MQIFENFISYRRSDALAEVQNIYQGLLSKGFSTFCDIYSLNSGRFDDGLKDTIEKCSNYILVLKEHSLDRCDDEQDWLRFEIATALRKKKNIICVFLGDFDFPASLPEDIDAIRYYNGIKYDYAYFAGFMDCLVSRFLINADTLRTSNSLQDFVIRESVLIKYIGSAPIVTIPDGVEIIAKEAFKDRTRVSEVYFPASLKQISDGAFERCSNLTHITLPDGLKVIGKKAFSRCYNLSFVAFNDSLESIEDEAFTFCVKLRMIQLGESLSFVASSAFNNCNKLARILIDENNVSYSSQDGILYDKEFHAMVRCPEGYDNDLITVPSSVEKVSAWCFSRCINIVDVILPRHLRIVEKYAFNECSGILSLTLGDDIAEFDVSALSGWSNDQRVVVSRRFNPLIKYNIDQKLSEKATYEQADVEEISAKFVMIKTTFESNEEASKMAKTLLSKRFIASAQLNKLNVFYTWNDEPCNEDETELSCITRGELYWNVAEFIKEHHSYECCQIICIPIIKTTLEFESWILEQTERN